MKNISVAVCLDDEDGMLFYGRRQSRDRVLIAELVKSAGERPIYISPFSQKLFADYEGINVSSDPLADCPDGGIVFIEDLCIAPRLPDIGEFIIYRWNVLYPSNKKFDVDLLGSGYKLSSFLEFEGSSHDNIRKEIHKK